MKLIKPASITLALGLTLVTSSVFAADLDLSKLPPVAKQTGVTYAKDIQPIFKSTCFRCHGEDHQRGDLRLDSLESALQGGKDGQVIIPGKSQESKLVIAVARLDDKTAMPPAFKGKFRGPSGSSTNGPAGGPLPGGFGGGPGDMPAGGPPPGGPGGGMPPKPKSLTPDQVGLIRAWIDQGAK